MKVITSISELFTNPFSHYEKVDFFRKCFYLFLLLNTISLLPIAEDLFGYHGIIGTRGWQTNVPIYKQGSNGLINLLSHPLNSTYSWVYIIFIIGQISFLITGLLNILPRMSSILIYFFTVNLFMKGYLAFTGGEVLMDLLLFYLIFIQRPKERGGLYSEIQNILNNSFYWIMLIQLCMLYFFSAVYKTFDSNWIAGDAIMYISRIENYSSGLMEWMFSENPTISKIMTFLTLGYQFAFPLLVWFKKVKTPFLILGVALQLGISFGMGIFTFGMVMILVYLLFLDDDQIKKIKAFLKRSKIKGLLKPFYSKQLDIEN